MYSRMYVGEIVTLPLVRFHYFRLESDFTPHKQLKEEAESVMQQLMTMVQYTAVSFTSWCNIYFLFSLVM